MKKIVRMLIAVGVVASLGLPIVFNNDTLPESSTVLNEMQLNYLSGGAIACTDKATAAFDSCMDGSNEYTAPLMVPPCTTYAAGVYGACVVDKFLSWLGL